MPKDVDDLVVMADQQMKLGERFIVFDDKKDSQTISTRYSNVFALTG